MSRGSMVRVPWQVPWQEQERIINMTAALVHDDANMLYALRYCGHTDERPDPSTGTNHFFLCFDPHKHNVVTMVGAIVEDTEWLRSYAKDLCVDHMIFWGVNSDPVGVASLADVLNHLPQATWFGNVQVPAPNCLRMFRLQIDTPPISVGDVWYTCFNGEDPDPTTYYNCYKIVKIQGKLTVHLQEGTTTGSLRDPSWSPSCSIVKSMYKRNFGMIKLAGHNGEYLRKLLPNDE